MADKEANLSGDVDAWVKGKEEEEFSQKEENPNLTPQRLLRQELVQSHLYFKELERTGK